MENSKTFTSVGTWTHDHTTIPIDTPFLSIDTTLYLFTRPFIYWDDTLPIDTAFLSIETTFFIYWYLFSQKLRITLVTFYTTLLACVILVRFWFTFFPQPSINSLWDPSVYWHDLFIFCHDTLLIDTTFYLLSRHITHWHDLLSIGTTFYLLTRHFTYWHDLSSIDTTFYLLTRPPFYWHDLLSIDTTFYLLTWPFIYWNDLLSIDTTFYLLTQPSIYWQIVNFCYFGTFLIHFLASTKYKFFLRHTVLNNIAAR